MSAVYCLEPANITKAASVLDVACPAQTLQTVSQAEAGVAVLAGYCLEYIDALLDALAALTAPPGGRWIEGALRTTQDIAARFIGSASVVGLPDLERAAKSLCELADMMREQGRDDLQPVRVHVEAMRLLRLPEAAEAKDELLAGLEQVRLRFASARAVETSAPAA